MHQEVANRLYIQNTLTPADSWSRTSTSEVDQNVNLGPGDYTKVWEGAPTHAWKGKKEFTIIAYV